MVDRQILVDHLIEKPNAETVQVGSFKQFGQFVLLLNETPTILRSFTKHYFLLQLVCYTEVAAELCQLTIAI
jgi:hypothetical protein